MPADEGDDTTLGRNGDEPLRSGGADRLDEFARRESELMGRLAEGRKRKISSLTRELVVDTIDRVQRLIEARPDRNRDS